MCNCDSNDIRGKVIEKDLLKTNEGKTYNIPGLSEDMVGENIVIRENGTILRKMNS